LHPLTWLGVPWLASVAIVLFCWGFITLWGAALVVVWAWFMQRLERFVHSLPPAPSLFSSLRRVLVGTALWCGLEWLWSLGPLGWTTLSYTQSPGNLALLHIGQLSGTAGVTAAIVAVNGLLAEAWMRYQQPVFSSQWSVAHNSKLSGVAARLQSSAQRASATQNSKLSSLSPHPILPSLLSHES
jgi:apolipoprotein N-acyltransferase